MTQTQKYYRAQIVRQKDELFQLRNFILNGNQIKSIDDVIDPIFRNHGITRYGFTQVKSEHSFLENSHETKTIALVFSYPMSQAEMETVPSIGSATEILRAYMVTGSIVLELTRKLRLSGFDARGHHPLGDMNDYHEILFPPLAMLAGLGEQGRTGLFIDHELGPLIRLGVVTFTEDHELSTPIIKGIKEFCKRCTYCVSRCPPRAILKTTLRESVEKKLPLVFKIEGSRCIQYFEKHYGCGRCLFHCVFAKPNPKEVKIRVERISSWYNNWIKDGQLEVLNSISFKHKGE